MSQGDSCIRFMRRVSGTEEGLQEGWWRYKQVSRIFCILRTHFNTTYCSQHSHRSSSYTPISPLLLFYISPIIAARVLTWLDLFLTSLVGFSPPCLLLLFFFFIFSPATCCMLSVSAAEIYEVQHATTTTPCPRGASRQYWLDIYIDLWGRTGLPSCLNAALNCGCCCCKHLFICTLAISCCVPLHLRWFSTESKRFAVLQSVLNYKKIVAND